MQLWMVRERWAGIGAGITAAWVAVFGIALVLAIPWGLSKWLVGALSIPALLGLAQHIPPKLQRLLARVGVLSLSIYLMNTMFIGLVKALMLQFMSWDGRNFLIFFPLLVAAGVLLPIAVKRLTGRFLPAVDRYI